MTKFQPNRLTFEDGLKRIFKTVQETKLNTGRIITSVDEPAIKALKLLGVDNVPDGFVKWQLPVYLNQPSQIFFSYGAPNTKVEEHSHDEGDGIRIILHGSIEYEGKTLNAGDWMYIPKGEKYAFNVGAKGVGMCYCYCCCCA